MTHLEHFSIKEKQEGLLEPAGLALSQGRNALWTISDDGANKGLEGIAHNTRTGTLFAMKEGKPGLLIELSPDQQSIQAHRLLNEDNGFCDPEVEREDIDFSDLCHDSSRGRSAALYL